MKRSALDDAWDLSKEDKADLRETLRTFETGARRIVAGGSLASVSANGRNSAFAFYGAGQLTSVEVVEMWRALIDLYDSGNAWLTNCAKYGLDPAQTELDGFPSPTPDPVANPTEVADADRYRWMMDHLIAITEARSDYSSLRTNNGSQVY